MLLLFLCLEHPLHCKPIEGKVYFLSPAPAFSAVSTTGCQGIRVSFCRRQFYSYQVDTHILNLLKAAEVVLRGERTQAKQVKILKKQRVVQMLLLAFV